MKFTLSWLREHLESDADLETIARAMTMAGLEVEHVVDPAARLAAFSVARIVSAAQHPNADRLVVCQVETRDGPREIVCGAPNARAGLHTIYAPIRTHIPGTGITLEARPVRGVVSHGMLCSAAELEIAEEADGILETAELPVGTPAARALGIEAVIDFEATPNRPDWLGVAGIARDLAAAGLGRFKDHPPAPIPGAFPLPIEIRLTAPAACPAFAGRLIRNVENGPSPAWLQARLRAIGLRPINALADITNYLTYDQARPLHVYDAAKIAGGFIEARMGRRGETLEALDGRTYGIGAEMCVIADASGAIGLGGVMGGAATGCSETTTEVFIESAWFDPILTAQTGRETGIVSDAQYRFARGVDPQSLVPGIERASALILELCGGEASAVVLAGHPPPPVPAIAFDPSYVERLSGLEISNDRIRIILSDLGFIVDGGEVRPPSWRRDVSGRADLVEEVARIAGYDTLPAEPLPPMPRGQGGALSPRQTRARIARRALAALGYQEAVSWSFVSRDQARLFGGGGEALVVDNPLSEELDCMRPSLLPGLALAVERNARRGFGECALFEIGPVFEGDEPGDQKTAIAAVLTASQARRWDGAPAEGVFSLKADLMALLEEIWVPTASLRIEQAQPRAWWRPGRYGAPMLGKTMIAEFGELHPAVLGRIGVERSIYAFEAWLDAAPDPRRKPVKTRPALRLSPLMPLRRDFAFVVDEATAADDVARAVQSTDRALIREARVFDVYAGEGLAEGSKSVAVEAVIQPTEATLSEAEIEALSARIIAAAKKTVGAKLRGS
ncbi:MAG: phenylalanine--tRNA ligase subunit beta [Caulobacteraceae bacterium]